MTRAVETSAEATVLETRAVGTSAVGVAAVGVSAPATRTVRDAAFDVLRLHGLTTLFANPGSTEVSLLTDLPADLEFVLALHEGSVVGAATGWALARDEPALVLLHTTAGLGNAVGALATARVNRAPWWSSWASRTAGTSPRSRSSPGSCTALPGTTRSGWSRRYAPRTCPAPSAAPCTPPARGRGPRWSSYP